MINAIAKAGKKNILDTHGVYLRLFSDMISSALFVLSSSSIICADEQTVIYLLGNAKSEKTREMLDLFAKCEYDIRQSISDLYTKASSTVEKDEFMGQCRSLSSIHSLGSAAECMDRPLWELQLHSKRRHHFTADQLEYGLNFRNRYHISASLNLSGSWTDRYEGPSGSLYDSGAFLDFSCSSDSRKMVYAYVWGGFGDYREGTSHDLGTWLSIKPVPHISVSADLDWSATKDARRYNWSADSWDRRSTDWKSLQLSGSYMLGTDISFTLTSQLSRFESEYELTGSSLSTQQWMNLLLSWSFSPGSMFYFMAGEHGDPDEFGELGDPDFNLFTKITWLLTI